MHDSTVLRCVAYGTRGGGITGTGYVTFEECEVYDCNKSNATFTGAFGMSNAIGHLYIRCIAHDNTGGSNSHGFYAGNGGANAYVDCISDSNTGHGFYATPNRQGNLYSNCDSYNNTLDGFYTDPTGNVGMMVADNCNAIKNRYGFNFGTSNKRQGVINNAGFGTGTAANSSGTTNNLGDIVVVGSVNYATDSLPWSGAASGDFRIDLAGAKNAGRGVFTQTQGGYTGTIGYPDIGSAPHQETGGGGTNFFIPVE